MEYSGEHLVGSLEYLEAVVGSLGIGKDRVENLPTPAKRRFLFGGSKPVRQFAKGNPERETIGGKQVEPRLGPVHPASITQAGQRVESVL